MGKGGVQSLALTMQLTCYRLSATATEIDNRVAALAARISSVPKNQLLMQKMMVNQALDNMGLESTQRLATLFDGITRHSPEG